MKDEFSLLCSNRLYLKKDFSLEDFIDVFSIWLSKSFTKLESIICKHNEIIYDDNDTEIELKIQLSQDKKFVFVRFDNHKRDEDNKTYRVDIVLGISQHLLQIELYCDKPSYVKPPTIIRTFIESDYIDIESYDFPINKNFIPFSTLEESTRNGDYDFDMPIVICNKDIYEEKKNLLYKAFTGFAYVFVNNENSNEIASPPIVKYHIPGDNGLITNTLYNAKKKIYTFHKETRDSTMVWGKTVEIDQDLSEKVTDKIFKFILPAGKKAVTSSNPDEDKTEVSLKDNQPAPDFKQSTKKELRKEPDFKEEDFLVSTDEKKSNRRIKRHVYVNDKNFQKLIANKGADHLLRDAVIERLTQLATLPDEDLKKDLALHRYEKLSGNIGLASLCAKSHKDSYRILLDYNAYNKKELKIIDFGHHDIYDAISSGKYIDSSKDSYFIFDVNNPRKLSSILLLNENQKKVAYYAGSPTLTKGCAGSGKTSVSVEKYSYLYESGKTDLVYLTYNEKLSIRIQNDLNTIFGEEVKDVHVRTVANFFKEFIEDECKESLSRKRFVDFSGYNGEKSFSSLVSEYNGKLKQSGKNVPKEIISMCPNNKENLEAISNIVSPFFRGIYKGSLSGFENEDYLEKNKLTRDAFKNALRNEKLKPVFIDYIFDVCDYIDNYLCKNNYLDDNDLAQIAYQCAKKHSDIHHSIIIDETQDLTERQIYSISKIACKHHGMEIHFYGDPNQTINPTILDLNKIDACFKLLTGQPNFKIRDDAKYNSNQTYRINEFIANFINHLIDLRKEFIGKTDALDDKHITGQPADGDSTHVAVVYKESQIEEVLKFVNDGTLTLLVTDEFERNDLFKKYVNKITNKDAVITISDFKGNEDDYVAVYNFIGYNKYQLNDIFDKNKKHSTLSRYIFNRFFVALTRARKKMILIEPKFPADQKNLSYNVILHGKNNENILTIDPKESQFGTWLPGAIDDEKRREKAYSQICEDFSDRRGVRGLTFIIRKSSKDIDFIAIDKIENLDKDNMELLKLFYRNGNDKEKEYFWESKYLFRRFKNQSYELLMNIFLKYNIDKIDYSNNPDNWKEKLTTIANNCEITDFEWNRMMASGIMDDYLNELFTKIDNINIYRS